MMLHVLMAIMFHYIYMYSYIIHSSISRVCQYLVPGNMECTPYLSTLSKGCFYHFSLFISLNLKFFENVSAVVT